MLNKINNKESEVKIWIFFKKEFKNFLTETDNNYASQLGGDRLKEYLLSRSYIRYALSILLEDDPFNIPLIAPPGKPPLLKNDGYISISHCRDAFLLAWSIEKIGIDIERFDRKIVSKNFATKFFNNVELEELNTSQFIENTLLKRWVVKESLIKWNLSSIFKNSKDWIWRYGEQKAFNYKEDLKVKVYQTRFEKWEIGIASNRIGNSFPIICRDL